MTLHRRFNQNDDTGQPSVCVEYIANRELET